MQVPQYRHNIINIIAQSIIQLSRQKFSSNVVGPGDPVPMPLGTSETDYEAELAVVIGRRAWRISESDAMDHVLGYACANDLSARAFQFADGQWQRGKSSRVLVFLTST